MTTSTLAGAPIGRGVARTEVTPMRRVCLLLLAVLAWPALALAQVGANHFKVCSQAATPSTTDVDCMDWNSDHVFTGGENGQLLHRDTGDENGANWAAQAIWESATSSFRLFGGSIGNNGQGVLALGLSAGLPTTSPSNTVQLFATDYLGVDGSVGLGLRNENNNLLYLGGTANVGGLALVTGALTTVLEVDSANGRAELGTTTTHPFRLLTNDTSRLYLDAVGNVGLGAETFGSSAVGVLSHAIGTAPTSSPGDIYQQWADDTDGAGTAGVFWRTESGHVHKVGRLAWLQAGTGTGFARAGGTLCHATGSVGTAADTNETVLFTCTLPANTLAVNAQRVHASAMCTTAANGNNKTIRLRFGGVGGTVIAATATAAFNNVPIVLDAKVTRTGAATQDAWGRAIPSGLSGVVAATFAQPTQTLSGSVALVVTGQNGTAAANDVSCKGLEVLWWPE